MDYFDSYTADSEYDRRFLRGSITYVHNPKSKFSGHKSALCHALP